MDETPEIRTRNPSLPTAGRAAARRGAGRAAARRGAGRAGRDASGGASSPLRRAGELTVLALVLTPIALVLLGISGVLAILVMSLFLN